MGPFKDQSKKKYLNHLLDIGPDKPMGYLPLNDIRNLCKVNYIELMNYLKQKGLEVKKWDRSFCSVGSGALYAYDKNSLQNLLDHNFSILDDADWPRKADEFVVKVATTYANKPFLYDLVADAFGDYYNPGKINKPNILKRLINYIIK